MNLKSQVELQGYGTSEGVRKEWDTRGRGGKQYETKYTGTGKPKFKLTVTNDNGETTVSYTKTREMANRLHGMHVAQGWQSKIEELNSQAAGGQTDSSSLIGRKYRVVDTGYGHVISEHDNPEDAEHAARARPYSKVLSQPDKDQSQAVRDIARKRMVKVNPDIDGWAKNAKKM